MKNLLLCLCLLAAGCELQVGQPAAIATLAQPATADCPFKTVAPVEIPPAYREANYGSGSCMWASFETVLRSQGQIAIAAWCRENCGGAAGVQDCARVADAAGLRYAICTNADEQFLQWCSRTRRAAAIHWSDGEHAVTFCGYNLAGEAMLIDNNHTERYERIPKAAFLAQWRASGGYAFTVLYWSPPPRPWYVHPS
jgi:hypothetical protein